MSGLVLSLFSGVGMLDEAFREEGWCVVSAGDVVWGPFYDIRRFHPPTSAFEGVIGGPPCQSFSGLANLQRAQGKEPTFGNLIPEFERVVGETEPAWFLMENVTGAPVPAVAGYDVKDRVLNNRWCGSPQNRMRRFSFGTRDGRELHVPGEALLPMEWKSAVTAAHGGERRTHFNRATGGKIQRYTVEEAAELQGLPDGFFDGMPFRRDAALKLVANGVPLAMGRAIAKAVRKALA
jgi:DNA (cytosine-5)-methyltransferase 1